MVKHQLTSQVKILHKVALIAQNQVLILKRHSQAHSRPSQWDLPGGNAEWPGVTEVPMLEHLHQADAVREVQEETGIQISEDQISIPVFLDTFFETEKQVYTLIVGWLVQLPQQPKVVVSAEHTAYQWVALASVAQYDFGFAGGQDGFIIQIIKQAFALSSAE